MGKNQHSKDKLWMTATEWKNEWGGKKEEIRTAYKRLPFYCCALSFQPWEDPMCTPEGHVFEILNIIPYIKKYGKNPVTGVSLSVRDLVKLSFHKNPQNEYHCPITFKVFSEHTRIVAIKTSGNVYAYEAIEELCMKPKHWKDLISDEPFTRKDIIDIQDPHNTDITTVDEFYHIKMNQKLDEEELAKMRSDPTFGINANGATKRILQKLADQEKAKSSSNADQSDSQGGESSGGKRSLESSDSPSEKKSKLDPSGAAAPKMHYSTGLAAASLTSTAFSVVTHNERAQREETGRCPKKKGYVRLHTNLGDLNVELHCDVTPRACENFMVHCESGYYNNVIFHRSIRNFMIQGGDPTGTGKGGESIWKAPFKDEFRGSLQHSGRGILSMANSGYNTNGSQFFILYKSAVHLNMKHTVFGKVVGGMEVLTKMEQVETDDEDRPKTEIKILGATVFVNPYKEMVEEEAKAAAVAKKTAKEEAEQNERREWFSNPVPMLPSTGRQGVGKYLPSSALASSNIDIGITAKSSASSIAADPLDIPTPPPPKPVIAPASTTSSSDSAAASKPSSTSKGAPAASKGGQFAYQSAQGELKVRTSQARSYGDFSKW
mmetsp:Transcript_38784/g.64491  ORF Transcript_38784/g.64491 Transcript_38784/m.64491 type:complete len:605 (-) Transcript_38784:107-1921(-)